MVIPNQNVIIPVDKTAINKSQRELILLDKNPPGSWVASVTQPIMAVKEATWSSRIPKYVCKLGTIFFK